MAKRAKTDFPTLKEGNGSAPAKTASSKHENTSCPATLGRTSTEEEKGLIASNRTMYAAVPKSVRKKRGVGDDDSRGRARVPDR